MKRLAQVIYGRGENGYGVLGASPSGKPFADTVASLCQAIGSPDRPGDIRPFLLSKREGENVLMVHVCRDGDSLGRATLLFHALVAPEGELSSAGLDAFVLSDRQSFASRLPKGVLDDLPFPEGERRSAGIRSGSLEFPAFVQADAPLDAEVRNALAGETLVRNWTTYSYWPIDGFDLCVYSSGSSAPPKGNRYAFEGGRFVALAGLPPVALPSHPVGWKGKPPVALMASLFANMALAAALAAVLVLHGNEPGRPGSSEPEGISEKDARGKWEEAWKGRWRRDLVSSLDNRLDGKPHIADFDGAMKELDPYYPEYKTGRAQPPGDRTLAVYSALQAYVSLVENEIVNPNSKK